MEIFVQIDLVPRENVQKWLVYLRGQFPTLAFKASTQDQKTNLVSCFLLDYLHLANFILCI